MSIKSIFKIKPWLFYLLSFTWGIVMTLIGCIASLILLIAGKKPKKNYYGWYFEILENWGGLELGCMCIVNRNPAQYTLDHEFGHAIQNCFFGPFMIIITIWSAIRYWYREFLTKVKKKTDLPPYDSIWFEGQATKIGEYYRKECDV
jgi:hypothetical protein